MKLVYDNYVERDGKKYPNPQFRTIDSIVIKGTGLPSLFQYHGSDKELINLEDFNEYGWEFIVNKELYNHKFALDYLTDKAKENIGKDLEDIQLASRTIFPTMKEEDTASHFVTYFGTVNVGKQKLLMVNIPRGYSSAELFDSSDITYIRQKLTPSGEILEEEFEKVVDGQLRPGKVEKFPEISDGKLEPGQLEFEEVKKAIPKIEIILEGDEILYSKIVWFVITTGTEDQNNNNNNIEDINISFLAWEKVDNPYRNLRSYLLRKDDKALSDTSIEVVQHITNPDVWMDMSSGTLVGNLEVLNHPLLDEKLSLKEGWDINRIYRKGDRALWNEVEYVSLIDNNVGRLPAWTPNCWMRSEALNSFSVKRVFIVPSDSAPGTYISPSSAIYSEQNAGTAPLSKFTITYAPGYVMDSSKLGINTYEFRDSEGLVTTKEQAEYIAYRDNGKLGNVWLNIEKIFSSAGKNTGIVRENSLYLPFKPYQGEVLVSIHKDNSDEGDPEIGTTVSTYLSEEFSVRSKADTGYDVTKILKSYRVGSEIMDTFDTDFTPEISDEGVLSFKDTYDLPGSILYDVYLKAKTRKIIITEYPGFIIDYIEREVLVSEQDKNLGNNNIGESDYTVIKFMPREKNFFEQEGLGIAVSVAFDDSEDYGLAFYSIDRTLNSGVRDYNPPITYGNSSVWSIKVVDGHYEIRIPIVLRNIKFKFIGKYENK